MTNLQKLPFVASFNASNMVPGQNVDITSPAFDNAGGVHTPANTVTLIPQTINATVTGSSASGAFTDYTASLANYDLFPALAVQPGQTTLLNSPSQIEVYVDSNTQLLNLQNLAAGAHSGSMASYSTTTARCAWIAPRCAMAWHSRRNRMPTHIWKLGGFARVSA